MERVQILWVGRLFKGQNDGVKSHSHPFYHLLFVQTGELQMTAGEDTYTIEAGQCVLIARGVKHAYLNIGKEMCECLEIKFSLPSAAMDGKYSKYDILHSGDPLAAALVQQIVQEYADLGGLADDAAASYLTSLLNLLLRKHRYQKRNEFRFLDASEYSELSQNIIRYLESHYAEPVSLDDVASAVEYNKSYMCTAFRKDTQLTINDCLNFIRIRRAAELIAYSDNDLSSIASMCGFSSASHFNQVFLKHVGTTPGQCRKAYPMAVTIMPERRFVEVPDRKSRFMYSVLAQKMITPEMILSFEKNETQKDETKSENGKRINDG